MEQKTAAPPSIDELLDASAATESFRSAVGDYAAGAPSPRVAANPGAPPVKVLRVVSQLLAAEPSLAIDSVRVDARSGCSDFRGVLEAVDADGGRHAWDFVWDCAWRAQSVGWKTFWGDPDQQKAAREYGWDCFEKFERRGA